MKIFQLPHVNLIDSMTEDQAQRLTLAPRGEGNPDIPACLAGNEYAIEQFVRAYETGVFRLALSILGEEAEAQEVTQETFLSALRSLSTYQERKSFKAWLFTIALNHSRSHLRKRKVIERLSNALTAIFRVETERQILPEEAAIQNERETAIWHSLKELDERHRIVVVLRYFHEFSIAEISEILSIKEGTIHSRLHSAREKLRDALKQI